MDHRVSTFDRLLVRFDQRIRRHLPRPTAVGRATRYASVSPIPRRNVTVPYSVLVDIRRIGRSLQRVLSDNTTLRSG